MTARPVVIAAFLERCGWSDAQLDALTGDFSTRRYARLTKASGETAFLMDADADQKTPTFVTLAKSLRNHGLPAPKIYAEESTSGLVLMQDFGSKNVGALIDDGSDPLPFFLHAADLLAELHKSYDTETKLPPDLPVFNTALLTEQAELFLDTYLPFAQNREASTEEREDFRVAWKTVLAPLEKLPRSLMLRDFMPDNLMALSDDRLGLLDFQDAGLGPIAYDLASLCEEIRREDGFALLDPVIERYRARTQTALSAEELRRACIVLSAQRHTRVLGIIARMAKTRPETDKSHFLPRIKKHLQRVLSEPFLHPVAAWMKCAAIFPEGQQ